MTTLQRCEKAAKDMDCKKGSLDWVAIVVLLLSANVGPSITKIKAILNKTDRTLYSPQKFNIVTSNAIKNGIWKNGKVYGCWTGKDGWVALCADAAVCSGYLKRT